MRDQTQELARFSGLSRWVPKVGDFVIWHGWFSRWYGIVTSLDNKRVTVLKENLPKLLFTMPTAQRSKNIVTIDIDAIQSSSSGEYHILQDGTWFIDD